jgi:hypothetical protein
MPLEDKIGVKIEAASNIENKPESAGERPELRFEKPSRSEEKSGEEVSAAVTPIQPIPSVISEYEQREKQIENFLAQGLDEIYLNLPLEKKDEFRLRGEETAREINKLMEKTRVHLGKIVSLIKKWLLIIPGVNKFFLEQEAKIKADEIIKLKNKK